MRFGDTGAGSGMQLFDARRGVTLDSCTEPQFDAGAAHKIASERIVSTPRYTGYELPIGRVRIRNAPALGKNIFTWHRLDFAAVGQGC